MPLPAALQGNWAARVRFAEGDRPFAYVPDLVLTPDDDETLRRVRAVLGENAGPLDRNEKRETTRSTGPEDLAGVRFVSWRAGGDALAAVRRLRAAGIERARPVHVFFADSAGDPASLHSNPVYANPVYANPVYANPVYANPVYANPVYANPVAAGAPLRSLVYPNPVYAFDRLDRTIAQRYRSNGGRRSQALPATVDSPLGTDSFPGAPAWDEAAVRVAVLDSGFDVAFETASVFMTEWVDSFDVDGDAEHPRDGDLDPVAGHGTFIAGLVRSVAPEAAVCVRQVVSTFGDGRETEIVAALDELVEGQLPPHVVNLSFSGYALDEPLALRAALQRARAKGIVIVASAGNDGIDRPAYPAAFPETISVGALGRDAPAAFSNYGDWVDACAPGADLTSWFFTCEGRRDLRYGYDPDHFTSWATWSGTSFAAPLVAGALAAAMTAGASQGVTADDAAEALVYRPTLFRLPGYGAVVNVSPVW